MEVLKLKEKQGRGRPLVPEDKKAKNRSIKMTDDDWEKIKKLAEINNLSVTDYIKKKTL